MATYSRKRFMPVDFDTAHTPLSGSLCIIAPNLITKRSFSMSAAPKTKKRRLTQLTIDLGGNPRKTCKVCGMEYVPSNTEDALLHKQFHNESIGGLDVAKGALEKAKIVYKGERKRPIATASRTGSNSLDIVVEVGRRDALGVRNLARKVLDVVEKELGAVTIGEEALWSYIASPSSMPADVNKSNASMTKLVTAMATFPTTVGEKRDRYKFYLYIQDSKCVGLCLTEGIREGRKVLACTNLDTDSSSISAEIKTSPAQLGISRIWVSKELRGASIAHNLLDIARNKVLPGVCLPKKLVAFSQPTDSGAKLARAWFGRADGWLVYDEQQLSLNAQRQRVSV